MEVNSKIAIRYLQSLFHMNGGIPVMDECMRNLMFYNKPTQVNVIFFLVVLKKISFHETS